MQLEASIATKNHRIHVEAPYHQHAHFHFHGHESHIVSELYSYPHFPTWKWQLCVASVHEPETWGSHRMRQSMVRWSAMAHSLCKELVSETTKSRVSVAMVTITPCTHRLPYRFCRNFPFIPMPIFPLEVPPLGKQNGKKWWSYCNCQVCLLLECTCQY